MFPATLPRPGRSTLVQMGRAGSRALDHTSYRVWGSRFLQLLL
jgi:hypothetical protein